MEKFNSKHSTNAPDSPPPVYCLQACRLLSHLLIAETYCYLTSCVGVWIFSPNPNSRWPAPWPCPASPERLATHRLYQGIGEFHQLPALLEMVWLLHDNHLYIMYCTYSLPRAPAAVAEVQQVFGSLAFAMSAP